MVLNLDMPIFECPVSGNKSKFYRGFKMTVESTTDYWHQLGVYAEIFKMTVVLTTDYRHQFKVYSTIFKLAMVLTTDYIFKMDQTTDYRWLF